MSSAIHFNLVELFASNYNQKQSYPNKGLVQLRLLRIASGAVWSILLFVGTSTASFDDLLAYHQVRFTFDSDPDWSEFLLVTNIFATQSMLQQNLGHFFGFFILGFILTLGSRSRNGLYLSVGFAVLTEILQMYFTRDGRLIDVFIDSAGIAAAFAATRILLDEEPNRTTDRI